MSTPFFDAWMTFLASKEGAYLITGRAEGQFLENRLHGAFEAGWNAANKSSGESATAKSR